MIEIFINDTSIDLYEGTQINLNYTNADIINLQAKGNFSYPVTVPASSSNKKLFVFPELDAEEAFNSQVKNNCRIEKDGTIILNGYAICKQINNNSGTYEYELECYDGNSSWIDAIKSLRLNDLDYSLYNHTYTKANIDASENHDWNSRYVYPLINYGVISDNIIIQDRTPWLNVYHVLRDIFVSQGYSINSYFLQQDFFRRLYFSPNGLPSLSEDVITANKFNIGLYDATTSNVLPKGLSFNGDDRGLNTYIPCHFNRESNLTVNDTEYLYHDTDAGSFNTNTYRYVAPISARMSFEWNYSISASNTTILRKAAKKVRVAIIRQRGTAIKILSSLDVEAPAAPANDRADVLGVITTEGIDVLAGDNIWCAAMLLESTVSGHYIFFNNYNSNTFKNEVFSTLISGQTVEINALMPDISQLEFLSNIKTLFNLHFYTNEFFKAVYIEPRDSFYSETALDWSSKLDTSKPIVQTYLGDAINKKTEFKYSKDSNDNNIKNKEDSLNSGFDWGSFRYDVNNVNSQDGIGEIKPSIFCPTVNGNPISTAPAMSIPIIWKDREHQSNYTDHAVRILYYRSRQTLPLGQYWNFEGTTRTDYPAMTMFYDSNGSNDNSLLWKNTGLVKGLFYKHWHNTINTIDNSKLVKMSFHLRERDINNLDFRSPIYVAIEGNGEYYHIQRIVNYNPTLMQSVEVELIRVIAPVPQVQLTETIPDKVNATNTVVDVATQPIEDFDVVMDVPTRVVIDGVEQTVDIEQKIVYTYKAIVGTAEKYVTIL